MRAPAGRGKVTPPLLLLVRSFSSVVKVVKSPKKESTTRQRGRFVSSIDTREDNNTEIAETEHEQSMMEKDKEKEEEVEELVNITLKTIGPARPSRLQLPSAIKVHELRKLVAADVNLPVEHLKLVLQGEVLHDTRNLVDVSIRLNEGDSVIVAVVPKPPAKHIRDIYDGDDNDELKFRMPQSTNRWKRRLFSFLHDKLRLPDILLMAIFPISLKAWAAILAWFTLAPVAYRLDIGPLYILATGFAIILLNLGQRKHGDLSAYSIFNDDFRELPGTLNADRLDRDIRAGQF